MRDINKVVATLDRMPVEDKYREYAKLGSYTLALIKSRMDRREFASPVDSDHILNALVERIKEMPSSPVALENCTCPASVREQGTHAIGCPANA